LNRSVEADTHNISLVPAIEGGEVAVEYDGRVGAWEMGGAGVCVAAVSNSAVEEGSCSEQAERIKKVTMTKKRLQVLFIQVPISKPSEILSKCQRYHSLNVRWELKVP
jgi:hypothetical protein